MRDTKSRMVFVLYFISGFTALVLEVVWARQACLIFGNTTLANAAVISAFMTGLAIGSFIFGKIADNKTFPALKLYGILEGGVGIFALFSPILFKILVPLYNAVYQSFFQNFLALSFIRFMLSFIVLLIPTTLMGGTFPLLSRFLSGRKENLGSDINRLYALNIFGAMAGTFGAGFIMINSFGLCQTARIAAFLNLAIFAYVMLVSRKPENPSQTVSLDAKPDIPAGSETEDYVHSQKIFRIILALMFIHGFVAFVVQISWLRTMALILGSSTYAFSTVLTTFLLGLALATYLASILSKKNIRLRLAQIGFVEMSVGLSIVLFIPVFEWLIYFMVLLLPEISQNMIMVFAAQFLFCAIGMLIPAMIIGFVFPSVISYIGRPKDIGKLIGDTYAINTLGGVLGSFTAAFFFIKNFGLNGSLHIVSVLATLTGFYIVMVSSRRTSNSKPYIVLSIVITVVVLILTSYPWDKNLFSSGAFIYSGNMRSEAGQGKWLFQKSMSAGRHVLFYKDGISSTVSILQHKSKTKDGNIENAKSIRVNGKTDASTFGDMDTQLSLAYIPMFAHPDPEKILVIGLGAGITLNAVSEFPTVKSIVCVEIEPAVIEGNKFFSSENNNVLKDPRIHMIIGDGRNHLEFSREKYDVIISEPSNPWVAGVSNLFAKENYESALHKLDDKGIFCQWFHAYQMSKDDFLMIMNTFASVFPKVNLFKISSGDYMLIGSKKDIIFNNSAIQKLISEQKEIENHLKYFTKFDRLFTIGYFMMSDSDLREALSKEKIKLNTDDRLYLEFDAPKYLYTSTSASILEWLYSIDRKELYPRFSDIDYKAIGSMPEIWKVLVENGISAIAGNCYKIGINYLTEALKYKADDPLIISSIAKAFEKDKNYEQAKAYLAILQKNPEWKDQAAKSLSRVQLKSELAANPVLWREVKFYNLLAGLEFFDGDIDEAERIMNKAIDIDPTYAKNYSDMAMYYFFSGNEGKGYRMLLKARTLKPDEPEGLSKAEEVWGKISKRKKLMPRIKMASALASEKKYAESKKMFLGILQDDPDNIVCYSSLAAIEKALGDKELSDKYNAKAEEIYVRGLEKVKEREKLTGKETPK